MEVRVTHTDRVVTPREGVPSRPWDPHAAVPAPLRLHECAVDSRWVDYNRHMSESCFLLVFGDNADAFFRYIGIDEDYRARGHSLYTVETHLHHRREVAEGEPLSLTLQVLDQDARRVHLFHEMHHGGSGALLASAEQMLVHVDTEAGRSCAMPSHLQDRLATIRAAHAVLPRPAVVGRPMGIGHSREAR
jgi:betainyl-CoA thioesterase